MKGSRVLDAEQRVSLNIRVSPKLHRAVQVYCLKHDLMIRDFMTAVVAEALARASKGTRGESKAR